MNRYAWVLLWVPSMIAVPCFGQFHNYNVFIDHQFVDSVTLGDRALIARIGLYSDLWFCPSISITHGYYPDDGRFDLVNSSKPADPSARYFDLYFAPQRLGPDSTTVGIDMHLGGVRTCGGDRVGGTKIGGTGILPLNEVSSDPKVKVVELTPDPFIAGIHVLCSLTTSSPVSISLFDIGGRQVRAVRRDCGEGTNTFDLDVTSLPAGFYWYIVQGDNWIRGGKVMKLSQ
ncbi:MAG: hypothetical protein Q8922_10235 [Bacteroidota bacterium]|nr:hypothetical protein [Bacteroidota bacterium]MDP4233926.1 hypothetical protein [Bacteroidota bacterium]MDP4242824.1 hypothetical protein [Bacteroidota bacterium]MDP4288302.1 hypothetical protein [Bacteroidota bacterium]